LAQNITTQNYPGSVNSYDIWPANEMGFFYNTPKPFK